MKAPFVVTPFYHMHDRWFVALCGGINLPVGNCWLIQSIFRVSNFLCKIVSSPNISINLDFTTMIITSFTTMYLTWQFHSTIRLYEFSLCCLFGISSSFRNEILSRFGQKYFLLPTNINVSRYSKMDVEARKSKVRLVEVVDVKSKNYYGLGNSHVNRI